MTNDTHYDVIIIGSGAGGGTLAYRLAPSGLRVLLLERGDYVKREIENWSTLAVNKHGRYNTKEVWRTASGADLHPHTNYHDNETLLCRPAGIRARHGRRTGDR